MPRFKKARLGVDENVPLKRYEPCEAYEDWGFDELIYTCTNCKMFLPPCCEHPADRGGRRTCHNVKFAFTDGACSNNGSTDKVARAGVGIALSEDAKYQLSIPMSDLPRVSDPVSQRTSQRAELFAALEAIRIIKELETWRREKDDSIVDGSKWIIASDSEYLVKGLIDWLPTWKANGFKTSQGRIASNLDLFLTIEKEAQELHRSGLVKLWFWNVPRAYNALADSLARQAVLDDDVSTQRFEPRQYFRG